MKRFVKQYASYSKCMCFCVKPLLLYDTWVVNGGGVVRRRMVLKCYTKNKLLYCVVHRQRSTITRCVLKTKIDRVSENRMFDYIKNTIQIYLDISCCLCYVVCFEQVNNYCFVVSILIYFHSVFFMTVRKNKTVFRNCLYVNTSNLLHLNFNSDSRERERKNKR